MLANLAWRMALLARRRSEHHKVLAIEANAAAEWWHDVVAWLDRADSWVKLRENRTRRIRRPFVKVLRAAR